MDDFEGNGVTARLGIVSAPAHRKALRGDDEAYARGDSSIAAGAARQ
jgi:hypothetical protein